MRMSCNGCRVLRKGCSEGCNIRPCLDWIESPESQANATLFLAKFYGRAGLVNLINAGPQHLRPSIFKSLLYEACGRIIHPIHGSTGLIRSNKWHLCQAAVDSVLAGSPISANTTLSSTEEPLTPPFQAGDIRHLSKPKAAKPTAEDSPKPRTTRKSRRSKRSSASGEPTLKRKCEDESIGLSGGGSVNRGEGVKKRSRRTSSENDALSGETVEAELLVGMEKKNGRDDGEVGLDLSLGFGFGFMVGPDTKVQKVEEGVVKKEKEVGDEENGADGTWKVDLSLGLPSSRS